MALRFLTASALFGIIAALQGIAKFNRRDTVQLGIAGFLGITLYQLALNFGELTVDAGTAGLLVNTAPIWTALISHFVIRQTLNRRQWAGILIGFMGVMLIVLGQGENRQVGTGALLVVLASLSHSISFFFQKPLLDRYRPLDVTAYLIWFGTLFLLPLTRGLWQSVRQAPLHITAVVVYLGIGPSVLAYVCWAWMMKQFSVPKAAAYLYLLPPTAMIIAWLWLHEVPTAASWAGGAVVLGGVVLIHKS